MRAGQVATPGPDRMIQCGVATTDRGTTKRCKWSCAATAPEVQAREVPDNSPGAVHRLGSCVISHLGGRATHLRGGPQPSRARLYPSARARAPVSTYSAGDLDTQGLLFSWWRLKLVVVGWRQLCRCALCGKLAGCTVPCGVCARVWTRVAAYRAGRNVYGMGSGGSGMGLPGYLRGWSKPPPCAACPPCGGGVGIPGGPAVQGLPSWLTLRAWGALREDWQGGLQCSLLGATGTDVDRQTAAGNRSCLYNV